MHNVSSSRQQFFVCYSAYLVLFFTVLLSDRLYIDDIARSIDGHFGWTEAGRPLADLVIYLINLGSPLINIAPLPQLISIAIVSYAATKIISNYRVDKPVIAALCTLPLAGQPYFLENISYCFDSPTMALGILFSIDAAIHINKDKIFDKLLAVIYIFLTLTLYQAALSVFFVSYLFMFLRDINPRLSPIILLKKLVTIAICTALALTAYIPITRLTLSKYGASHSAVLPLHKLHNGLYDNLYNYIQILHVDWGGNFVGYVMVILVMTAFLTFILSALYKDGDLVSKLFYVFIILLGLPAIVFASYCPQIILNNVVWAPRTFIGIGAILALSCLQIYSFCSNSYTENSRYKKLILTAPIYALAYSLIVFSFSFAKANASQKDFEAHRLATLVSDAEDVVLNHSINSIGFIGSIGQSPLVHNSMRKFPLIERLVRPHLNGNWWWGHKQLQSIGFSLNHIDLNDNDRELCKTKTLAINKAFYSMYTYDDKLIVIFKQ